MHYLFSPKLSIKRIWWKTQWESCLLLCCTMLSVFSIPLKISVSSLWVDAVVLMHGHDADLSCKPLFISSHVCIGSLFVLTAFKGSSYLWIYLLAHEYFKVSRPLFISSPLTCLHWRTSIMGEYYFDDIYILVWGKVKQTCKKWFHLPTSL